MSTYFHAIFFPLKLWVIVKTSCFIWSGLLESHPFASLKINFLKFLTDSVFKTLTERKETWKRLITVHDTVALVLPTTFIPAII